MQKTPYVTAWAFAAAIGLLGAFLFIKTRAPMDPQKAALCIVGEAEAESFFGKLVLAHALINRGSFMAVYGCDSKRVRQKLYPRKALIEATMAWTEAVKTHKENDLANGAANWLSVEDYRKGNTWVSFCEPRVEIGGHIFVECP